MSVFEQEWTALSKEQKKHLNVVGCTKKSWPKSKYDDFDWEDLPRNIQKTLKKLGVGRAAWDEDDEFPGDEEEEEEEEVGVEFDEGAEEAAIDGLQEGGEDSKCAAFEAQQNEFKTAQLKHYFGKGVQYVPVKQVTDCAQLWGSEGAPSVNDVLQNNSCHCWYLSTLQSISARYPDYMRSLAEDLGNGRYTVKLFSFKDQNWSRILCDDEVPVKDGECSMAGIPEDTNALWPMIFQKALGRYVGSFSAADYADPLFSMGMLTGCTDLWYVAPDDESNVTGDWTFAAFSEKLRTNKPHDYDYDDAFEDPEKTMPWEEVSAFVKGLWDEGYIMCISSDAHAIAVVDVQEDCIVVRDQADEQECLTKPWDWVTEEYYNIAVVKWTGA
eukprot:TRINITY_DN13762_c0_g2_i1.p1 TRINITY_DN13762_c0_g2~~TRINITY_DN13762_c0_g2_i1.p1  ORF type:complete len:384 (+),score=74.53 TRINITY_DN13762_c0_g2_i1:257-1408(+)